MMNSNLSNRIICLNHHIMNISEHSQNYGPKSSQKLQSSDLKVFPQRNKCFQSKAWYLVPVISCQNCKQLIKTPTSNRSWDNFTICSLFIKLRKIFPIQTLTSTNNTNLKSHLFLNQIIRSTKSLNRLSDPV